MNASYRFRNKFCPICGKIVDPYHYRLDKGRKICVEHYVKHKSMEEKKDGVLSLS